MTITKNSKMMSLLNYRLRLTITDARVITGQMLAFDKHMNLVLADCEEFRTIKPKKAGTKSKAQQIKRTLGLVILRGENVISISVDGPPPVPAGSADHTARKSALAPGPGVGRPANRGMPPTGAPPGLAGPVRGVGGPASGAMLPRGSDGSAASIAAGPISFSRPPPPPPHMMPGMPGFRPPPAGFRPPPPPPGFRPPPPGFRSPPPNQ